MLSMVNYNIKIMINYSKMLKILSLERWFSSLKALAALIEVLDSVPLHTYVSTELSVSSGSQKSGALLWPLWTLHTWAMPTGMMNIRADKILMHVP